MGKTTAKHFDFRSLADVESCAQRCASELRNGETWLLSGNLGSGKTTFAQAVGRALGVVENITSPTFVFVKMYATKHAIIKKLVHADLYRLHVREDVQHLGLEEEMQDARALVCIEWPELLEPPHGITVRRFHFSILSPGVHSLTVDAGERSDLK